MPLFPFLEVSVCATPAMAPLTKVIDPIHHKVADVNTIGHIGLVNTPPTTATTEATPAAEEKAAE